jgi:uncharacterized protein YhaN
MSAKQTIIEKVRVFGFGSLGSREFQFAAGLNVIEGPNEAGKSTLLACIHQVLFGFEKRNSNKRFESMGPEYGGEITLSDSLGSFVVRRVSGKRTEGEMTLRDANGNSLSESRLHQALGSLSKNTFSEVFSISLDELRDFARLGSDDELKEALSASGVLGTRRVPQLIENLSQQAADLFGARASRRPLNLLLGEFRQLKELHEQSTDAPALWLKERAKSETLSKSIQTLREQQAQDELFLSEAKRWKPMISTLHEYEQLGRVENAPIHLDASSVSALEQHVALSAAQVATSQNEYDELRRQFNLASVTGIIPVERMSEAELLLEESGAHVALAKEMNTHAQTQLEKKAHLESGLSSLGQPMTWLKGFVVNDEANRAIESFAVLERALETQTSNFDYDVIRAKESVVRIENDLASLAFVSSGRNIKDIETAQYENAAILTALQQKIESHDRFLHWQKISLTVCAALVVAGSVSFIFALAHFFAWACMGGFLLVFGWRWFAAWKQRTSVPERSTLIASLRERASLSDALTTQLAQERVNEPKFYQHQLLTLSLNEAHAQVQIAQHRLAQHEARSDSFRENLEANLASRKVFLKMTANEAVVFFERAGHLKRELTQLESFEKAQREKSFEMAEYLQRINQLADDETNMKLIHHDHLLEAVEWLRAQVQRWRDERNTRSELEKAIQRSHENLIVQQAKVIECEQALRRQLEFFGVSSMEQFREALNKQSHFERAQHRRIEIANNCERQLGIPIDEALLLAPQHSVSDAELTKSAMRLAETLVNLNASMKQLGACEELCRTLERQAADHHAPQQLASCASKIEQLATEHAVRNLTFMLLEEARGKLELEARPAVVRKASSVLNRLSDKKYVNVVLDERDVKSAGAQVTVLDDRGKSWPLSQLSRGTREMVLLAFRLALISHLASGFGAMPVMLDDVQVNLDSKRKDALVLEIQELAKNHQVFVATCHNPFAQQLVRVGAQKLTLRSTGQLELL